MKMKLHPSYPIQFSTEKHIDSRVQWCAEVFVEAHLEAASPPRSYQWRCWKNHGASNQLAIPVTLAWKSVKASYFSMNWKHTSHTAETIWHESNNQNPNSRFQQHRDWICFFEHKSIQTKTIKHIFVNFFIRNNGDPKSLWPGSELRHCLAIGIWQNATKEFLGTKVSKIMEPLGPKKKIHPPQFSEPLSVFVLVFEG